MAEELDANELEVARTVVADLQVLARRLDIDPDVAALLAPRRTAAVAVCPRCDQGEVVARRVVRTGEQVQICEECDAIWASEVEPSSAGFETFQDLAAARGIPDCWSELT